MPFFQVTSRPKAEHVLREQADLAWLVSITCPVRIPVKQVEPVTGFNAFTGAKLSLVFDDLSRPPFKPGDIPPSLSIIDSLVDFFRKSAGGGPGLIHCMHGQSRSVAAGLILLSDHLGPSCESEAADELRARCTEPVLAPNMLMLQIADEFLRRHGKLVAAGERMHASE